METTRLRGARTHNLKGVDLDLAPGQLIVVAGVSGAGKSALALDTLYAEGQRRFVESFSAYARQFLERRDRPPVDSLDPVPAAIAVDRGAPVRTSRSTVGTMTELSDYMRLLWARASVVTCDACGREVRRGSVTAATDDVVASLGEGGGRVVVTYPVAIEDAERYLGVRESLLGAGYRRAWIDGRAVDLDEVRPSSVVERGVLDVLVDRFSARAGERDRVAEAVGTAMARGERADVHFADAGSSRRYAQGLECAYCAKRFAVPAPGLFSFQSPVGACPGCKGFGRVIELDWDKVVPDHGLTLAQGAIKAWGGKKATWERRQLRKLCESRGIPMDVPWRLLNEADRETILRGRKIKGYHSVRAWFDWMEARTYRMHVRVFLARYRKYETCTACGGSRMRPEVARYRVAGHSIIDAGRIPVAALHETIAGLASVDEATDRVVGEILTRLQYLQNVGLGYLTLERPSRSLSGGEVQRVSLTAALGTSLTGTLMVLDEPTVGLHPRDAGRLVDVARGLAALGNLPIVVEHDLSVIASADRVIEMGPGAGERGGQVVFDGSAAMLATLDTPTGRAMRGGGAGPTRRRTGAGWLSIGGARGHNLRSVDVKIPLGALTCVTGVSGSGKSSLISETLYPAVARTLGDLGGAAPLLFDSISGVDTLRSVTFVDQGALGRTSRGNAATYVKAYEPIRELFAREADAKARGYTARTFSFNVEGGRCTSCNGEGFETVEMQFLADVAFRCPDCAGRRFRDEVLEVRCRGMSIADALESSATRIVEAFHDVPALVAALQPMIDVGLGYLSIGQPLSMLSGGEAQRLKLARALVDAGPGTLIILDEPTAGLHRADVEHVVDTLQALVDRGATIIAIEHDPFVAARADHIVDIGPEAADGGGTVVAVGTPEHVAASAVSRFAPFLREALAGTAATPVRSNSSAQAARSATDHSVVIDGAHEHNLRVPHLEIPRERLVVMTGPSGSGKSSLAFDVVYAEGQRRFLETLSPYARQYLPSLGRADVERIAGIPPAISLEQRTARAGAMSTVATVTEVAHYVRLLFAKVGTPHCPKCDLPIGARSPGAIADDLGSILATKGRVRVWAPVVRGRKGVHADVFERARRALVSRVRVDGVDMPPRPAPTLARSKEHDIAFFVADVPANARDELRDAVERAVSLAEGHCVIERADGKGERVSVNTRRACAKCGRGVPELDPRHFSFSTRQGQCPKCEGAGADEQGVACKACRGARLGSIPRGVRLGRWRYHEIMALAAGDVRAALGALELGARETIIANAPRAEVDARLGTLVDLGLDYLALDRAAGSLSGGEMQRLRLAAQIGAGLTGVLYVLDEPTIGLHGRDTHRLVAAMRALVRRGASVIVVEHDADVIRAADHVIDLGPGGGRAGGCVVAQGEAADVLASDASPTGRALREAGGVRSRGRSILATDAHIEICGARAHNLQQLDVRIPLARLVCIAGVSGSGKSTLVDGTLVPALRAKLKLETDAALAHDDVRGWKQLRGVAQVDQSPIGRTPRSVPATYIGMWDEIRKMFAATVEARARGFGVGRFSFNTSPENGGGRCEGCDGGGVKNLEMSFLPDVVIPCDVCSGLRFARETREVRLHGYDAGEILRLTVEEARQVFAQVERLARPLRLLADLGLGYLTLGQGSHTLSGGEAQRIKIANELQGRGGGQLYVLDEPTTGLHVTDVARLIDVLQRLVDRGDSLIVVEHHPSVLAAADWIIELGPDGGAGGGRIVAEGTPADLARGRTATGVVLRSARNRP